VEFFICPERKIVIKITLENMLFARSLFDKAIIIYQQNCLQNYGYRTLPEISDIVALNL
jgi:hypothetical protein